MRHLVLSDLHANLPALEAVLEVGGPAGYDSVLLLGDVVGYGPHPGGTVERVRSLDVAAAVRGNHDRVASGLEDPDRFNTDARRAALWTRQVLEREERQWLRDLPQGPVRCGGLCLFHGAPDDEDGYLLDPPDLKRALEGADADVSLCGHTHLPLLAGLRPGGGLAICSPAVFPRSLRPGRKYLINPGSVGQPRDGDPRASAGILDTGAGTFELLRVEYPVGEVQEDILRAGLPESLARRLERGE